MRENKSPLLLTLIALNTVAIISQIVYVIRQFGYLLTENKGGVGTFITNLISSHQLPILPMLQFIAAQLLLYAIVTALIYLAARTIARLFKLSDYLLGIVLWLITAIFMVTANSYYFPHSTFAIHHNILVTSGLLISSWLLVSTAIITITGIIINRQWRSGVGLLIVAGGVAWLVHSYNHPVANNYVSSAKQPNVIIIGLDSIRPDHVGYYGYKKANTPNIDKFLGSAANFTQAYSALARTYVAWNSILTGKYPKHDGVRDNLIDPATLDLSHTLAVTLRKAGYETMFATDNRQFSLINKRFGFDQIISPNMGIYDFILSQINDFPLSNLVMNSPFGYYMFPYNYANRMSYVTYEPNTFNLMLNRKLAQRTNKPLFLAMHIILTHWPYMWAHDHQADNTPLPNEYNNMQTDIDQQFGNILTILRHNHLLKHAIVVLLSDHGVSLGLHGDRIISINKYVGDKKATKKLTRYAYSTRQLKSRPSLGLDTASGEGIDILSFNSSNHIILGFKTYGLPFGVKKDNSYPVSLIDIAPTITNLLHLPVMPKVDGRSLKPFITSKATNEPQHRTLFFETGIWMPLFSMKDLKSGMANKYINQKLGNFFGYNAKHDYVIIKRSAAHKLLNSKQRAVLYGNWYLSRYPKSLNISSTIISAQNSQQHCDFRKTSASNDKQEVCYIFRKTPKPFYVLVNTKTRRWTLDLNSSFAKTAPTKLLLHKLKTFYGKEIPS